MEKSSSMQPKATSVCCELEFPVFVVNDASGRFSFVRFAVILAFFLGDLDFVGFDDEWAGLPAALLPFCLVNDLNDDGWPFKKLL
jgi:hypothetical protein